MGRRVWQSALKPFLDLLNASVMYRNQGNGIVAHLVVPLLIQVVYQPVLALVAPTPPSTIPIQAHTAVASARGQEARTARRENNKHILAQSVRQLPASIPRRQTYREEPPDARPHGVIGQLSPSPLVHDGALVYAASDKIDEHCDQCDYAEDAAW